MYSALAWVPKGVAKAVPEVAGPTEEEVAYLNERAENGDASGSEDEWEEMDEGESNRSKALKAAAALGRTPTDEVDEIDELDMAHYDDDDEGVHLFAPSEMAFKNNKDDPYLQGNDEDSEEEIEDFTIRSTDLLLLAARTEDDVSHLEVWVFEEESDDGPANMYVHHDLMLPAFPLSVAWLDCYPDPTRAQEQGNFVAISTFMPEIEIWNLDVLDAVEPAGLLGGYDAASSDASEVQASGTGKKKKKKSKAPQPTLKSGSHSDAVLSLSWNSTFRNVLASASADMTVKVWDVAQQTCQHTLTHHTNKVQAVAWNPVEASVMLTGGFDKSAHLLDVRNPGATVAVSVSADVECLAWDPHTPTQFLVSTEDGMVVCHDARLLSQGGAAKSVVYQLAAHEKATCAMSFNHLAPQLLATASTDKTVKLWDTSGGQPTCLARENVKVGAIFAMGFAKDNPFLLATGGSKGDVSVWDTLTNAAIHKKFGHLAGRAPSSLGTGMISGNKDKDET